MGPMLHIVANHAIDGLHEVVLGTVYVRLYHVHQVGGHATIAFRFDIHEGGLDESVAPFHPEHPAGQHGRVSLRLDKITRS